MFTHDFNFNKDATYFKVPQIVELEKKHLKAKNNFYLIEFGHICFRWILSISYRKLSFEQIF